ncbi:hypothetical protein N0V93_001638 [Gnomoniopsis smithogilvyi]|uniref:C2H2-type domain-containing protein n=1 Tax=Gnomoniopsis smithogilvyi TaxID=1191159 RepID=A0A9W8Z3X1_9PEZI|nr:hypothetical protein N0V93_001638 [Gnomoniopsis smithogilvyi]
MASSQDESEWDKSTSEIQSEDSEDLFESRPNRWRGPPQSWRTLTEEDRLTFNALERLRNQDLAVHLYNAFALKTTPLPPIYQDIDASIHSQGSHLGAWAPPKSWTAWPLRVDLVPPDDLMKSTEDEDDALTFRKAEFKAPSSQLEEVISAAILRFAKEKFRKRQLEDLRAPTHENSMLNDETKSSEHDANPSRYKSEEEKGKALGVSPQQIPGKGVEETYKPTVATDDDASYELIRPSTRAILSKLDQTLTILHNARNTSYRSLVDSASSSSDAEDDLYDEATPSGRRSRSRAKSHSRPTSRASSNTSSFRARFRSLSRDATASPSKRNSNRGRKIASVPREGESEREFLRRRAKEQKKRQPVFSGDESTTAAEGAKSPRKSRQRQTRSRSGDAKYWSQKKLDRLNLRDWSDVMGAAALSGFDTKVIERATQRCANLFGQGMDMIYIDEGDGMETKRYVPGPVALSSESEDENQSEQTDGHQKTSMSHHSSLAPSRAISLASSDGDEHEDERRGIESPRKRQRRSSSRGSVLESYFCHHSGCERAIRSFDRPANLRRHLKLVHGEQGWQESHTPQPERRELYICPHADCERASRPFDKGHNLRRHLQLVHGQTAKGSSKGETPTAQYYCPHEDCNRASRPFDRRTNLKRHMKLVHGEGDLGTQRQSQQSEHGKETTDKPTPVQCRREGSFDDDDAQSEEESSTESESGSASE